MDPLDLHQVIEIINRLDVDLDLQAAVARISDLALALLDCERVTLWHVIEPKQELRAHTLDGVLLRVRFGEGIAGRVAQTGELLNVPDAYAHGTFNAGPDAMTGFVTRNILCCAIPDRSGRHMAVLQALNKHGNTPFGERDEELLRLVGAHFGNALAKSRLHEEVKREKARLAALGRCFRDTSPVAGLAESLAVVRRCTADLLSAKHVFTFLVDTARATLWLHHQPQAAAADGHADGAAACAGANGGAAIEYADWLQAGGSNHAAGGCLGVNTVNLAVAGGGNNGPAHVGRTAGGALPLLRFKLGEGLLGQAAKRQSQIVVNNARALAFEPFVLALAPLLGGEHAGQVLLQPVVHTRGAGQCLAVLVAVNKLEPAPHSDLFYDAEFTDSDNEVAAVYAMQVANVLAERSLEISFASALSIVADSGTGPAHGVPGRRVSREALRSQVLDYFRPLDVGGALGHRHYSESSHAPQPQRSPQPSKRQHRSFEMRRSFQLRSTVYDTGADAEAEMQSLTAAEDGTSESSSAAELPLQPHHQPPSRRPSHAMPHHRMSFQSASTRLPRRLSMTDGIGLGGDGEQARCTLASMASIRETSRAPRAPHHVDVHSWDLDMTVMSADQLCMVAFEVFIASGAPDALGIAESAVMSFVSAAAAHYHANPYHNLCHAVHVVQATALIVDAVQQDGSAPLLRPHEHLALLVAAMCHDLEHDGRTNAFHIVTNSDIAQRYNDISVLENHHCALTFEILRRPDCALFAGLDRPAFMHLRRLIIGAILGTDLSNHGNVLKELRKAVAARDEGSCDTLPLPALFNAIMHAADLSNHLRPFHVCKTWSDRVHAEFQCQVRAERDLGLPVAPHMDAHTPQLQAQLDVNFINTIVLPLWSELADALPGLHLRLAVLLDNRMQYARITGAPLDDARLGYVSSTASLGSMASESDEASAGDDSSPLVSGSTLLEAAAKALAAVGLGGDGASAPASGP